MQGLIRCCVNPDEAEKGESNTMGGKFLLKKSYQILYLEKVAHYHEMVGKEGEKDFI